VSEFRDGVLLVDREEFCSSRFAYQPGQHVTFLGRTDSGKTTLAYQLLRYVATPKLPALSLVAKPKSATVDKWRKTLDHPKVTSWPPPLQTFRAKPTGWMLWPKHSFDPDQDDAAHYAIFRRALNDSYKRGHRIVFADEALGLVDLGLERNLVAVWTRGREMPTGLWAATQKPSHIPLQAYNQATHLFLAFESDRRNRQRFSEISGFDSQFVGTIVTTLNKWEWLYINTDDRTMCIVLP
jgi:hypothetical protein